MKASILKTFVRFYVCFFSLTLVSMNNPSPIFQLPDDILLYTISLLQLEDLNALSNSNKFLNTFMQIKGYSYYIKTHEPAIINTFYEAVMGGDRKFVEGVLNYHCSLKDKKYEPIPNKIQPIKTFDELLKSTLIWPSQQPQERLVWDKSPLERGLIYAIKAKHYDLALLLIKEGADVNPGFEQEADPLSLIIVNVGLGSLDLKRKKTTTALTKEHNFFETLLSKGAFINEKHIVQAAMAPRSKFILKKLGEKVGHERVTTIVEQWSGSIY